MRCLQSGRQPNNKTESNNNKHRDSCPLVPARAASRARGAANSLQASSLARLRATASVMEMSGRPLARGGGVSPPSDSTTEMSHLRIGAEASRVLGIRLNEILESIALIIWLERSQELHCANEMGARAPCDDSIELELEFESSWMLPLN